MTTTTIIPCTDIETGDERAAFHWLSDDGRRSIDMSGATAADAIAELLAQCGTDEQRAAILRGSLVVGPTAYSPIPAAVQTAWDDFKATAERHGLRVSAALLHTKVPLAEGEDRTIDYGGAGGKEIVRYWPDCGSSNRLKIAGPPTRCPTCDAPYADNGSDDIQGGGCLQCWLVNKPHRQAVAR